MTEAKRATRLGWTVGVNAPGYLPDSEPNTYPTFDDAFIALMGEMVRTREALFDDAPDNGADSQLDDACAAASDHIRQHGKEPFSVQLMGIAHWVERAEG